MFKVEKKDRAYFKEFKSGNIPCYKNNVDLFSFCSLFSNHQERGGIFLFEKKQGAY